MFRTSGVGGLGWIAASLVGLCSGPAAAQEATPSPGEPLSCFFIHDWAGWKSPSPTVIYLRIHRRDIYRVDLTSSSPDLDRSDMHLVSESRGSDLVCSALDLQLSLAGAKGFREPLIVKTLTRLSAEEVAEIPRWYRP